MFRSGHTERNIPLFAVYISLWDSQSTKEILNDFRKMKRVQLVFVAQPYKFPYLFRIPADIGNGLQNGGTSVVIADNDCNSAACTSVVTGFADTLVLIAHIVDIFLELMNFRYNRDGYTGMGLILFLPSTETGLK